MKKRVLIVSVLLLILTSIIFAQSKNDDMVQAFLSSGSFIILKEKKENIYYPKHAVACVECTDSKISFIIIDKGYDYCTKSFSNEYNSITLDENNNIIIKRK